MTEVLSGCSFRCDLRWVQTIRQGKKNVWELDRYMVDTPRDFVPQSFEAPRHILVPGRIQKIRSPFVILKNALVTTTTNFTEVTRMQGKAFEMPDSYLPENAREALYPHKPINKQHYRVVMSSRFVRLGRHSFGCTYGFFRSFDEAYRETGVPEGFPTYTTAGVKSLGPSWKVEAVEGTKLIQYPTIRALKAYIKTWKSEALMNAMLVKSFQEVGCTNTSSPIPEQLRLADVTSESHRNILRQLLYYPVRNAMFVSVAHFWPADVLVGLSEEKFGGLAYCLEESAERCQLPHELFWFIPTHFRRFEQQRLGLIPTHKLPGGRGKYSTEAIEAYHIMQKQLWYRGTTRVAPMDLEGVTDETFEELQEMGMVALRGHRFTLQSVYIEEFRLMEKLSTLPGGVTIYPVDHIPTAYQAIGLDDALRSALFLAPNQAIAREFKAISGLKAVRSHLDYIYVKEPLSATMTVVILRAELLSTDELMDIITRRVNVQAGLALVINPNLPTVPRYMGYGQPARSILEHEPAWSSVSHLPEAPESEACPILGLYRSVKNEDRKMTNTRTVDIATTPAIFERLFQERERAGIQVFQAGDLGTEWTVRLLGSKGRQFYSPQEGIIRIGHRLYLEDTGEVVTVQKCAEYYEPSFLPVKSVHNRAPWATVTTKEMLEKTHTHPYYCCSGVGTNVLYPARHAITDGWCINIRKYIGAGVNNSIVLVGPNSTWRDILSVVAITSGQCWIYMLPGVTSCHAWSSADNLDLRDNLIHWMSVA